MNKSKLTVACNWDPALIEGLKPYAYQIKHIFGKSRADIFSGGRAAGQVVEPEERQRAEEYIKEAKGAGLVFNYLLNGTVLPNEFDLGITKRVREDLDWIVDTGVEWVTVSNPRIAEMVRDHYPDLKTNISVFAHVRTPRQVERWKKRGARSICLDRHLVGNTKQLEALKKEKPAYIEYTLLANDPCLLNCEKELSHDNLMSRASVSGEKYFHSCSLECLRDFISNPAEILASTYIRPEDLGIYEGLGIDAFKIVDRNRSTEFILNAVEAYSNREYRGNLLDLMSLFSAYDRTPARPRKLQPGNLSEESIDHFWKELPSTLRIYIDNTRLGGHALKRITSDCESKSCTKCNICLDYADLVHYDVAAVEIAKQNIDLITARLNSKGM